MKTTHSVRLYLAIAVLALALVSGGCAMAPKAERYVFPPLGSEYTTSQSNTGSYGSGISQYTTKITERTYEGKRMMAFESSTGVLLANADGSWSTMLGPDGKPIFSWDPPAVFDFPLEVGKTWTKSYRLTMHATKQTIPFDSTGKVEAYEDVTVPAGTFKAFKISTSDTLGNENLIWYSPDLGIWVKQVMKRTAKNPSGPGTREQEIISQSIKK
jgi:hypothetical protein